MIINYLYLLYFYMILKINVSDYLILLFSLLISSQWVLIIDLMNTQASNRYLPNVIKSLLLHKYFVFDTNHIAAEKT